MTQSSWSASTRQRAVCALRQFLAAQALDGLAGLPRSAVRQVRGRGLWAGVEFADLGGREACERLAALGVLAKDTHGTTIRLAPPLMVTEEDLDWALDRVEEITR